MIWLFRYISNWSLMKNFVVTVIGIGLFLFGCYIMITTCKVILSGGSSKGVIISKYMLKHPDGDQVFSVVRYNYNAINYETEVSNHTSDSSIVTVGDSITVFFDKSEPNHVFTDKKLSFIIGLGFVFFGGFFVSIGIYLYKKPHVWDYFENE